MKGIVLAGGAGTRLHPLTKSISKQLLPIYDKPMIYYPISVLMLAGIREILVISTPEDLPLFQRLLGDGHLLGVTFQYEKQEKPAGLAQAFLIGKKFVNGRPCCLILGDKLFYGHGLLENVPKGGLLMREGALIFAYQVRNPERYGVIEIDPDGLAVSIEEKPTVPKSNYAVPGLYFYDGQVCAFAETLKPSARGELEITDLNRIYMDKGILRVAKLGRGIAWLDTGTPRNLVEAAAFVEAIEERQGLKIACLEEIAVNNGWIGMKELSQAIDSMGKSPYSAYLKGLSPKGKD